MKKYIALVTFAASIAFGSSAASAATERANTVEQQTLSVAYDNCEYYLTSCMISQSLCEMLYEVCRAQQNG